MKRVLSFVLTAALLLSLCVFPASALTYRGTASDSYKSGKYYQYLQNITLTGDQRTDTVAIALSQMGYQEGATSSNLSGESGGSSNYTEYMRFVYGNESWAWCAAFMAWSLYQSGASDQNGSSYWYRNHTGESGYHWTEVSCPYWKQALENDGLFKYSAANGGSYTPQTGDLIFFYSGGTVGHIGMVVYTSGSTVYTIEGNTSSGTGVEANGGGVYFKSYPLSSSSIVGYGVLDYASGSNGDDIDYSGANPTTGLYMTAAYKYLYADQACTTRATYGDGVYVDIPRYTMVEVTGVSSDGSALTVTYDGVTGYLSNNSADRVIQLTSTGSGGSSGGSSSGGTTTGGVHQLQGVGTSGTKEYHLGIDISYYQVGGSNLYYDMIDFAELKEAGCEFVILRAGDTNLSGYIDPAFIQLYKNARAAGMALGVYYFSRATTYAGSQAEAEWLIDVMEANDMYFEYPIYIDIETAEQGALGASAADQLCLGWCETMEKAGYYPGVYSNYSGVFDVITSAVTDYYDLWIASVGTTTADGNHWTHTTKDYYSSGMSMWQYSWFNLDPSYNYIYTKGIYTSTAQTTPVTDLDMDVSYKDYPAIMEKYGYNNCGDGSAGSTTNSNLVSGKDYTTSGTAGDPYYANLTDGVAGSLEADYPYGTWCGWSSDGTVVFDLGENYDLSSARIHLATSSSLGISPPTLTISVSDDGTNYTTYSEQFPVQTTDGEYWSELDISGIFEGRYVKISIGYVPAWSFLNEIEIYGEKRDDSGNLAYGGNYTTSTSGTKHTTATWQDDEIRLTDGSKSNTDTGSPYSGWIASDVDVIVDLGSVKDTGTYYAYAAYGFYGITTPTNLTVSVSTDGTNYTVVDIPVAITTISSSDSITLVRLAVSSPVVSSARYVKFSVETAGGFIWLDEVEVYAKTSGGAVCTDNLVSGMDYTITTGTGAASGDRYTANLTDGVALSADDWYTTGAWFGFNSDNTDGNYGAIVFDLGTTHDITGARVYLMNGSGGIEPPSVMNISVSDDGTNYTVYSEAFPIQSDDGSYWAELDIDGIFAGRYVRISFERGGSWAFMNEIEIYGSERNDGGNLALGGNYTTSSDGSKHTSSTYQDDEIRLTDGTKSVASGGGSAYSGWNASNVEVIVDLGSVKSTGTYSVYSAYNYWGIKDLKNVKISVSTNGVNYTEIYAPVTSELVGTGAEITSSSGTTTTVQLMKHTVSAAELASARYVKFSIEASDGIVWIDEVEVTADASGSEVCYENLLSGMDYTSTTGSASAPTGDRYTAGLTDGEALPGADGAWYNTGAWFGLKRTENTSDGYADLIFDLGNTYDISGARIHLANGNDSGVYAPESLRIWVSADGVNYTNYADFPLQSTDNICYWAELDGLCLGGRYVKITCQLASGKSWAMLNEIEVYGTEVDPTVNLAQGGNYTTSSDGSVHTSSTWQDDEIRLTNGSKSEPNGSTGYSAWTASNVDVIVDLGSVQPTGTYKVYSSSGYWGLVPLKNVTVSVSTDGVNYITIDNLMVHEVVGTGDEMTTSSGATVNVQLNAYTVSSPELVPARYVKFSLTSGSSTVWIDEVEVYAQTGAKVEAATITMNSHTVNVGDAMPEFTYTVTDANGNPITISGLNVNVSCAVSDTSVAGTYAITATVDAVDGYEFTVENGTLTVNEVVKEPETVTITLDDYTVNVGDAMPSFTYTVTDANGNAVVIDGLTVTTSCTAADTSTAGTYTITATVGAVDGYEFTVVNGTLTVKEVDVELFDIYAANVRAGDGLDMYFYVELADLSGTDYYAEITKTYADGREDLVTTVPYAEWESYNSALLRFSFADISAKEMTDEIYVTIYNGDGSVASNQWTDSVRNYAVRALQSFSDTELLAALIDMLNYGAAAQDYFDDYNIEDLANAGLDEYQQYATATVTYTDSRVKGENYAGTTVSAKSKLVLTMYFNNITTDMTAYVSYTDHYGNEETLTVSGSEFVTMGSMYGVDITGLSIADGRQLLSCEIRDSEGNVIASASDSVESYVARVSTQDVVFEQLMKFVDSAYNYFH